jgi:hypothetical protein
MESYQLWIDEKTATLPAQQQQQHHHQQHHHHHHDHLIIVETSMRFLELALASEFPSSC